MVNYTELKNKINARINTNGNQQITGKVLNEVLNEIVSQLEGDMNTVMATSKTNTESIATVNSNLVTSIENINKNMADGFNTINGGINNEIRPSIEKNTEDIVKMRKDIITVNNNLVQSVESINKNVADGFNTINGGIDNEIRPAIEKNAADIVEIRKDIITVNNNLVQSVESINKNVADGFNTINGGIDNEIRPSIEKNTEDIKTLNTTVATVNENLVSSINTVNENMANGFNTINGALNDEIRPAIQKNTEDIEALKNVSGTTGGETSGGTGE